MSTDLDLAAFERRSGGAAEARTHAPYETQCLPLQDVGRTWHAQWLALLQRAHCENPFLHPAIVEAGGLTGLNGDKASALTLVRGGQLEGLVPFRPFRLRGLPFPDTATSELNDYHFNGAPLISKVRPAQTVSAWFSMFGQGGVPRAWVLRNVNLESAFTSTLRDVAADAGFGFQAAHRYQRPMLTHGYANFENHCKNVLSRKRLKDTRRNLRRLGEEGEVQLRHASHGPELEQALENFLRMEASGWKGEAGTALLSTPETAAFARAAFCGQSSGALVSIDQLFVDDTPVAAAVNLQAGKTRFTPKGAIDEAYRRFSPGLIMEFRIIEAFYGHQACDRMDSAITTDAHIVAGLWNEEASHGDVVIASTPWRARAVAAALACDAQAKPFVKGLRERVMKSLGK